MRHRHGGQTLGMHEGMNSGLPCANFPRKTSIEKNKKQTLARKIRKRNLKFWYKSAKGNKNRKKKLENFRAQSLFNYRYPADLSFSSEVYKIGSNSLKAHYLDISTFAYTQKFDRCVYIADTAVKWVCMLRH